jgi:hypothetical protein
LAKDCWYKESNKSKRPSAFVKKLEKRSEEMAAAGMDISIQEYLLGLAENEGEGLLEDPDLWIADTAATVHMTPYRSDLTNLQKLEECNLITMGNGLQEEMKEVADVIGTISNNGKEMSVRIQDVTILSNGRINLFSISQMLKKGWRLKGNQESITITKSGVDIVFGIKILTRKGVLYGAKIK